MAKSVKVTASSSSPARMTVANGRGPAVDVAPTTSVAGFTPLELQASALASCIAASIRIAARAAKVELPGEVNVEVEATKAEDLPSRLARFDYLVSFADALDPGLKHQLIEEAEKICTISNTLRQRDTITIAERPVD